MTLDLQPYNENDNNTLDLQPLENNLPKRFQGSISPTPEYSTFDKIGSLLKNIANIPVHAWKQGSANVRTGELNFKLMNGGLDELEQSELNELENRTPYNYGSRPHAGLFDDSAFADTNISNFGERLKNTALNTIGQGSESYPFSWEIMKSGGIGGVLGGLAGGVAGGAISTAKTGFAGTLSGFKNGALLGARVLGGAGATKKTIELEAGLAYQELKNMKDDDGNTINPELAKRLAYGVGITNAGLEMTGAIAELSTFPMADKILKSAKVEAIKNIVKDKMLSNKLLSAGSKAIATHYAMDGLETSIEKATKENINRLAKATITEMTTEGLQEMSNVIADEWAKQIEGNYSDAIFSENGINSNAFKENMARIVQASAMAFIPAFTIGGVGTTATAVNIARRKAQIEGLNPNEAENFVRSMDLEHQVDVINDNEEVLQELADEQYKEEKFTEIQDQSFNKMINAGMSEAEAFSTAKVVSGLAKTFNNVDMAQEWADNLTFVSEKTLQGGVEMNVNKNNFSQNSENISEVKFQTVNTAGAETSAEISDAKKEWQEKGTDSKYFKKWFGDSKVVDENGKPKLLTDGKDIYITDGYSNNGISRYSYKGSHRSPSYSGGDVQERLENSEDVNLLEVAQGYHNQPDDYFSPMGARYYMYDDKEGLESARAVRDVIAKIKNGKENITVKIYRAVPADVVSDKLKNGDWVSLSKSYAIEHGEQNLDGEYKIIEKEVPINEVWWDGNDLREWGYDNGKEQEADLYLKIENPKYQDTLPTNWKEAREFRNQGYDGIITPNGEYLVFEKTQIKSVDNRGTFDESNPNIYYQAENNSQEVLKQKYLNEKQNALKNFYDVHKAFTENEPGQYNGERTIKAVLNFLGSKDNKKASIKTPIENVTITRNDVKHLLEDNEKERSSNLNRVLRTLQNPNLIINENIDKTFKNYYLKIFSTENKKTAHLQVIKCCNDGNFYVTNFHLKNGKLKQLLKNGQIIYDLSDKSAVQNAPDNIIINDNSQNFNPNNILLQGEDNVDNIDSFSKPKSLEELHEQVRQNAKGMQYLGYFTEWNGKDIIGIMENANASTVLHELAHSYLNSLKKLAQSDEQIANKYEAVKKWLGVTGNNELTTAQHEKFAKGFEAYIYFGKAPNKNLQSVFTQFKNWLKQIHDYWLNNRDNFEMPYDVKEVFDTIFENNSKVIAKRRKVKTYLDNALRITVSDTLPMLDSEKRNKDFAYKFVSIATGYKEQYLKAILGTKDGKSKDTQKEEIARRCAECDDKLTVNGFNPEWTEFYPNEKYYAGNDHLLAETALSDIVNNNFNNNYTNADFYSEFDAQYNYLLNTYKDEILDRDAIIATIYEWIEHIGKIDSDAFEIYLDRFEKDFTFIDSFENASALEQAKIEILELAKNTKSLNTAGKFNKIVENMNKIADKVKELKYVADNSKQEKRSLSQTIDKENVSTDIEAYRNAVKEILNKINFLTPNDKAKMFANIIDAPSANFLEAKIDRVMDIANTMCEVQQRNDLLDAISKELKSTDNKKQNNKLVGKYDYRTNKLFANLRNILKLTSEQANDLRIERQEKISEAESEGMSFEDRIINTMIQVKSDGKTYANTALIKQLYDDICALKIVGKNAKTEEEMFNKLNNKQNVNEVISIIKQKKEGNILEKFYVNTTANWESMLNAFFNKAIKDKYSLIWNETKASTWIHDEKTQFEKEVQGIYGLSKWNFDAEILKNLSDEYEFNVNTYDKVTNEEGVTEWKLRNVIPMKMNRMQIILAYMWDKNEVLHERMVNMFGEDTLIDMIDNLREQDKRLGDLMMRTVNKYYPLANAQYIKKYGIDLPKVSAYFPSIAEREGSLSELDLFRDFTQKSTSPSFSKMRSESTHVEMRFGNPVAMLYHHIDTMGRFINLTEPLDRINKVFNNSDVKKYVKYKYGDTALKEFMQQLVDISYKQNATVRSEQMRIVNAMVSNWTSANIIGKVSTGLKQLFACLNYTTVMPVNEWNVRFLKALSEPKETIKYMYKKIDYLRYRFESGSQNEALKEWVENNQIEEWFYNKMDSFVKNEKVRKMLKSGTITIPRKIKDVASLFLRCGDMGAIIFGGKPYIDYLIEVKKMTEEQAIKEFVVETQRTQQSAEISTLSNWQVASTQNPFSKLFMNYKNAQGQFLRKIADSLIDYKRGDIDKTQLAKDLFMYGFYQSFLFKIATSLSVLTLLNTGDADDLLKDIKTSIFDNLTFFHAFGDIGVGLLNKLLTGETTSFNSPLFGDIPKEVLRVAKKDADIEDWVHAIGFAVQLKEGIPLNAVVNSASGIGDIATGDIQKGLLRAIGYTKNRSEIATGQKNKGKNSSKTNNKKRKSIY